MRRAFKKAVHALTAWVNASAGRVAKIAKGEETPEARNSNLIARAIWISVKEPFPHGCEMRLTKRQNAGRRKSAD
jgi:hypothetical protein